VTSLSRPQWSDELAEAMARELGMPPGSEWAMIWPERKIDSHEAPWLFLRRATHPPDTATRFSLPPNEVRAMEGFTFELFGRIAPEPATDYWHLESTPGLDTPLRIEVWWLEVPLGGSLRAVRAYDPLLGSTRRSVEITGPEWERDVQKAKRGFLALDMMVVRPGPKPGTVAKFKTRPEWLDAIRERVLTKRTLATADDDTIAHWLGISSSLLYDLMKRWGPPRTIKDLREGNF